MKGSRNYQLTAVSTKHIGGRDEQQDSVVHLLSSDNKRALLVLADGMGGHSGGSAASRCVISSTEAEWENSKEVSKYNPNKILQKLVMLSYSCMKSLQENEAISPRSTFAALLIKENTAYHAHLGDSRLYHFRNNSLLSKTKDHSVVQMLVDLGNLHEDEMATHEDQGKLLKWVGGNKEHELIIEKASIMTGDNFLLCSDGLWEHVSTEQIENALEQTVNLEKIANSLVTLAKQSGAEKGDNISIALLSVGKENTDSYFKQIRNKFIN